MNVIKLVTTAALLGLATLALAEPPMPEKLPADQFNTVLAQVGEHLFIAGQPTEAGLEQLRDQGVTTVVNLRTTFEMDNRDTVPFDEAAAIQALGMRYVHIPSGGPDTPYDAAMVNRFAEALEASDGKVLLHCTVAWRASHLYTAYLNRYRGLSLPDAVRHGSAINLGQLPLEGFLGTPIEIRRADD